MNYQEDARYGGETAKQQVKTGTLLLKQTPPDDSEVLLSVPLRSPPLLQHHQGLSVEDEATEKESNGGYEHYPQAVCHVVPGQTRAAEVKAGIHLYTSQG